MGSTTDRNLKNKLLVMRLVAIIILLLAVIAGIICLILSENYKGDLYEYELEYSKVTEKEENLDDAIIEEYYKNISNLNKSISICNIFVDVSINVFVSTSIFLFFDLFIKTRLDKIENDDKQMRKIFSGGTPQEVTEKLNTIFGESGKHKNTPINVKIICYGTGSFDGYIDSLLTNNKVKTIQIVACSPSLSGAVSQQIDELFNNSGTPFAFDREQSQLAETIASWNRKAQDNKNLTVFQTKVLPTIRGILVMDKTNEPLFCAFQPYYMTNKFIDNMNLLTSNIRSANPFTVIVDENNADDIQPLSKFINEEFERLSKLI